MSPRTPLAAVLLSVLAAACAGTPDPPRAPSAAKLHLDWLRSRPIVSPWGGTDRIPATRKPGWFCTAPVEHPELAACYLEERDCQAAAGKPDGCEAHARAACSESLGACYPTIAICEGVRGSAARDAGKGRARPGDPGTPCAWQDGSAPRVGP